ncbi:hypothetical protein SKAU_G00394880 [Synaphobranchus kaupii]|uniref:Uncharacterized protein n=1 Tax=Synaphobranchus kaupii TaxID=118154 RepID=A0A9Q1EC96_SYNKA|nr:hypothetical protein SKAU_G00394880 [Synaphobranchus kaupii]
MASATASDGQAPWHTIGRAGNPLARLSTGAGAIPLVKWAPAFCQRQLVLVTSETPLAPESIPPLTEVTAQEAEVKELTLSAPAVEQENEVQNVVQDAGEAVEQAVEEEAAEEAAAPEPAAETLEPAEQEAEAAGEVGQEVALEVAEEAAAVEEPAPEEEVVVEEVAQPVGEEAEVAEAEPAQEEAVPEPVGQGEPAVVEAAEEVVEEVREEAAVGEAVEEGTEPVVETAEEVLVDSNETGASQASETGEPDLTPGPADTYVPAESQGPAIPAIPSSREETNHVGGENVQESNDFNEIITSKDELLNPVPAEEAPTLDDVVVVVEDVEAEEEMEEKEEQVVEEEEVIPATASAPLLEEEMVEEGESVEATADEGAALGLEAWKIGAISAAVFLFLETIVIIVYFLKCRKKTVSGAVPVKATEDCEAAQTTAEEASESSPASEDQTQQNNIAESLDMSQFQQEETMADIPLDPPAESSPEEPTDDVRTSVL